MSIDVQNGHKCFVTAPRVSSNYMTTIMKTRLGAGLMYSIFLQVRATMHLSEPGGDADADGTLRLPALPRFTGSVGCCTGQSALCAPNLRTGRGFIATQSWLFVQEPQQACTRAQAGCEQTQHRRDLPQGNFA